MFLFAHPDRLWLLLILPLWGGVVAFGVRRRRRDWTAIGQSGRPPSDGSWAWLVAMVLLIPALAQPRWGRIFGHDPASGHDVVFLIDASRSMAAEDAVPDRMGVALATASSLLGAIGRDVGDRVAIVAFAGRGVVRCPLTENLDAAADSLQKIQPGDVQPGGTDLGSGLETALNAFDDEEHAEGRSIVVFSDGEDHIGGWTSAIDRLRADRVVVHCVAIGDPDRDYPVPADRSKSRTRRSDLAFEALAKATGGALMPIGLTSADLGSLYRDKIEPTARRRRDDLQLSERVERFPAFVLVALTIGLVGSWPGLSKRRARRLAFAALALAVPSIGAGQESETAATLIDQGRSAYASGRFADALSAFDRATALDPSAAVPRYNAAATLFQLGRFPESIARYSEARAKGNAALVTKADFALGNARLAMKDLAGAIASYDSCLASTARGSGFDAVRKDAAINRAFAVERLKPPPEEPSGDSSGERPKDRRRPSGKPGSSRPDREGDGSPNPGGDGGDPSNPTGNRGAGGAGGSGQAPPEAGSPRARLNDALKEVRESRKLKAPDPAPKSSGDVVKDW